MKTIEEKAKAYDEAIKKAKAFELLEYKNIMESVFPELKDSGDNRIRQAIINYLKKMWGNCNDNVCGVHVEDAIAWLEQQKNTQDKEYVFRPVVGCDISYAATQAIEQQQLGYKIVLAFNGAYIPVEEKTADDIVNEYYSWLEKQGNQKHVDKNEPKFHSGDWIVDDETPNDIFCVIEVLGEIYKVIDTDGDDYHIPHCKADKQFHLWTPKDAKCGDVLISSLYKQPFIYNGNYTYDTLGAYFGLNHLGKLLIGDSHDNNWTMLTGVQPATKEQCNILFKKLHDSDYKWVTEKKELWHKYL